MPSIFSKCYRLCNTCMNTCSQLLHLSPEQQKKKNGSNTMKPTIVIVPGAWQNTECYESLRGAFSSLGYDSICRSPPSTTLPHGDTDLAADVTFMRDSVLQPLLAEGKNVVLLMHSFGGVYGGASVRGLSRTERAAQGLKGGVVALLYMAAACVPSGMTTLERMGVGEDLLPWVSLDKSTGLLTIPDPIPQMFHNLPADEAARWARGMRHQAIKPMQSTVEYAPFEDSTYKGNLAYLMCTDDHTFHLPSQKKFLQGAGIEITDEIPTSHMPFLEKPEKTAEKVLGLVEKATK